MAKLKVYWPDTGFNPGGVINKPMQIHVGEKNVATLDYGSHRDVQLAPGTHQVKLYYQEVNASAQISDVYSNTLAVTLEESDELTLYCVYEWYGKIEFRQLAEGQTIDAILAEAQQKRQRRQGMILAVVGFFVLIVILAGIAALIN